MARVNHLSLLAIGAMCIVGGIASARPSAANDAPLIRSAMSAAPATVARRAAIVASNSNGSMRTVRRGNNGFTCMADNPTTPGPDPMCMDANAWAWAMAWMGHKTPPANKVGLIYMLSGGTDASNTDPYATKPTGKGDWVRTGPHIMIVGSPSVLQGYPAGPSPDASGPYVMWANTPYAHLMVPTR